MNKYITVSFESEKIKVVYADYRHGNVTVEKTFTFSDSEFDHYLETTKDDEFIVVNDFQNIYQDVISIPPAQDKYLRTLIELEIKKRIPDLKDFSFFYEELRDVQKEGKKSKDVFFFAVPNEDVDAVLKRFVKYDKVVTYLYPNALPLSRFLHLEDAEEGQPVLGVVDLGVNKTMFLVRDEKLSFVRVAQSEQRGVSELDIENVNMTIAYCRQVLRLNPSRVVFLGIPESGNTDVVPIVPVAAAKYPAAITAFGNIISEFIVPIAAIIHARELSNSSLLPAAYKGIIVQRKILTYAIIFLVLFSFLGLSYGGFKAADMIMTKSEIAAVRKDISEKQHIVSEYNKASEELTKLEPLIKFMNTAHASSDLQKILASLQVFSMNNVRIKSISIKDDSGNVALQIEGNVSSQNYKELQSNYERLIESIKAMKELELVSQALVLKEKDFRIEVKWKI